MDQPGEQVLQGGLETAGLVRVGDTTRRPPHARSGFVDELLNHLAAVGFTGAPRALGYDERGRQVLTYLEGEVLHTGPHRLSDARILSATTLIREYHDAAATSTLCAGCEVVCHGDLGPHNTVFRGDAAVGLIDWDADVGPGRRLDDFADAVWGFTDLTSAEVPVAEQARKVRLMCGAYPGMNPAAVVESLTAYFRRARARHEAAGRAGAKQVFTELISWMERHGPQIAAEF